MAKSPWRAMADSDLNLFRPERGRFTPVVMGVLVAAIATFIAAYYVPLYRAHAALGEAHRALSQKGQALSQKAQKLEADLQASNRTRAQLEGERLQREAAAKADGERIDRVRADVAAKLDRHIKKGSLALVAASGTLVVAFDENLIFLPQKSDVSPAGRVILCDVAKISGGSSVGGVKVTDAIDESSIVPNDYPTAWAFTAARAAAVAGTLAGQCAVPAPRLVAVGAGKTDPFGALLSATKLPAGRLELEISPGAPR